MTIQSRQSARHTPEFWQDQKRDLDELIQEETERQEALAPSCYRGSREA